MDGLRPANWFVFLSWVWVAEALYITQSENTVRSHIARKLCADYLGTLEWSKVLRYFPFDVQIHGWWKNASPYRSALSVISDCIHFTSEALVSMDLVSSLSWVSVKDLPAPCHAVWGLCLSQIKLHLKSLTNVLPLRIWNGLCEANVCYIHTWSRVKVVSRYQQIDLHAWFNSIHFKIILQ